MSKFGLWVRRNSPTILMVNAIVNEVASVALACIATKRLPTVTKPASKKIVAIHTKMEKHPEQAKQLKKDLTKVYLKTGGKIALMYAPSVISFGLSAISMVGSHNILKGRNAALAAAFTTLKGGYDAYRQRVRDKLGDEEEQDIFDGITNEKIKEKDENDKSISKTISKSDSTAHQSDFSVLYGPHCLGSYDGTHPNINITFLESTEDYLNRKLVSRGYVFLYEVYEALCVPESYLGERKLQASRVLGWRYSKDNPSGNNFISFGIHDKDGHLTKQALNLQLGLEDSVWLTFNPDGDILTGDNGPSFMEVAIKKGM